MSIWDKVYNRVYYTHERMYITYVNRLHYTNVYYNRQLVVFIEVNLITYTRYLQTIQSDDWMFYFHFTHIMTLTLYFFSTVIGLP